MDIQLEKAMRAFYSDPNGWSTNEIYEEYCNVCKEDEVVPRAKTIIVREICNEYGVSVGQKRKVIVNKYFVRK